MNLQKILIIERQEGSWFSDVFEYLASFFKEKGFEVHVQPVPSAEYDYQTIKAHCRQYTPNILIIDDALLVESIVTFCKSVRENPETKQIGLFIMSSKTIRANKEWWHSWIHLIDEYITMPFEILEMERALNSLTTRSSE